MTGKKKAKFNFREMAEALLIAAALALFIRTFVFQAFKIPSGSMLPTLLVGDHLLVNKFIYGVKIPFTGETLIPIVDPAKGDIVVFRFPKDPSLDYIKRVVATPGDTLEIRNKKVFVNGRPVEDAHAAFTTSEILDAQISPRDNFGPVLVPENRIFVMGDNRDNSYDSRFWGFVDYKDVLGKAMILYWSWDIDEDLFSFGRLASIRWSRIGDLIH